MLRTMPLPPLVETELELLEDLSPVAVPGFLTLKRRRLRVRYPDGRRSDAFVYDNVDRRALDAVVVAPHFQRDGECWIFLRSALRPAAALRRPEQRPLQEKATLGQLWELPAGLVEADEVTPSGLMGCAARELEEELGFDIAPAQFQPLGPSTFPCPGVIGERHHFFHVAVVPAERHTPSEDGSVLEQGALIVEVSLKEALRLLRTGHIEDGKTEIALRRLAEVDGIGHGRGVGFGG